MALVEFPEAVPHPLDPEKLVGFFLDHPRPGMRCEAAAVDLRGWVIGRATRAVAVEIVQDGRVVRRTPVNGYRPDVAAVYPEAPGADTSGFAATLRMLGVSSTQLMVQAVLGDHTRVPLVSVLARGRWVEDTVDLPLVSVVIPCFNQGRYLCDAIESVLVQTYPHLEVVVVDDGSSDNTAEVAARYPGVRVIRQTNQGLAAARNTGLRSSNGEYLVFLDADDRLLPGGVAAGLDAFRVRHEAAFVCGRTECMSADGTVTGVRPIAQVEDDAFAAMLRRCFVFGTASVLYRRSVFDAVGTFRTCMAPCEDYDMYLRIASVFPVHAHSTLVAAYRWHGTNSSGQAARMLETTMRVLRAQWPQVRRSGRLRHAYGQGVRDLQQWWGPAAASQTRAALSSREWRDALRGLRALVRCYPRGLPGALLG